MKCSTIFNEKYTAIDHLKQINVRYITFVPVKDIDTGIVFDSIQVIKSKDVYINIEEYIDWKRLKKDLSNGISVSEIEAELSKENISFLPASYCFNKKHDLREQFDDLEKVYVHLQYSLNE